MSSIFKDNYVQETYEKKNFDYTEKFCKHIAARFGMKHGDRLLDIGCGDGIITNQFDSLGIDSFGIDISEASNEFFDKSKFRKHNLLEVGYPADDNLFDFVFCKSVVEHLREPDILIDEAFRVLKKGGVFICMTPSWKHSYQEAFYIDHTHVTPFTRYSLQKICEMSGFKSKCEYFYQLPLLWRCPLLHAGRFILQKLPIPYAPFSNAIKSEKLNKIVRFSKEAMLLCEARKS